MFIQVRLLKGFPKPLLYKVPDDWPNNSLVGKLVHVPIRSMTAHAVVIKQFTHKPAGNDFTIKSALLIEPFPNDLFYQPFIKKLSSYHHIEPLHFLKRIRTFLEQEKKAIRKGGVYPAVPVRSFMRRREHVEGADMGKKSNDTLIIQTKNITLTDEQQTVTNFLLNKINKPAYTPTVLHGVTGSGKTECYKKIIEAVIDKNKTAILMLPEVTLALQFERLMRAQLNQKITIFGFHSATSARDKKLLWKKLISGEPVLIIGVHLPILLPIANLGLIIIDEEHEVGYQEKKHPKINSKEAALIRAQMCGIPIVLGSATPSVSSLYNVKKRNWHFFQLKKRFSGNFPKVKTVLLTDKKFRRNFWISQKLEDEIRARLRKKEQTIIFLNRRGFSFFVQCKDCSFIFECPNCSVSLTLHKNDALSCHYCEHARTLPAICPACKKEKTKFIKKGIGTQQVVTILENLFPHARIGRADLDTTRKKKLWHETVTAFEQRELDILVGTQTITKGYHFPGVTLVGVLWADLNLHFPVYNATETTLQQLIQVAGRAGRQSESSTVIIQTMGDHPVFAYLNEIDYLRFYANEIQNREQLSYPPHGRLAEIELKHTNEDLLEQESITIATKLLDLAQKHNLTVKIMGPALPPVSKIKQSHIRKIYLKAASSSIIDSLLAALGPQKLASKLFFTPNSAS